MGIFGNSGIWGKIEENGGNLRKFLQNELGKNWEKFGFWESGIGFGEFGIGFWESGTGFWEIPIKPNKIPIKFG